jgi:hypothetical protein
MHQSNIQKINIVIESVNITNCNILGHFSSFVDIYKVVYVGSKMNGNNKAKKTGE